MLRSWLAHPLTRGLDIDDPRTTSLRRSIIADNSFLRKVYQEWYAALVAALPPGDGPVLEIGSGAGFLRDFVPGLITSDVYPVPGVAVVLDAHALPFPDASLRGVVMTNVLHHLRDPRRFFTEAGRCVRVGGAVTMIEPWVTRWSRLIYTKLHHEPFDPGAARWELPKGGPLSGANGALPWILFGRDRAEYEREFAGWRIRSVRPGFPFRYLLSGGVSLRQLMPGWTFGFWRALEGCLRPWMNAWGMFAQITLDRVEAPAGAAARVEGLGPRASGPGNTARAPLP